MRYILNILLNCIYNIKGIYCIYPVQVGLARVGQTQVKLDRVGLARIWLARVGLSRVGLSRVELARVGRVRVKLTWIKLPRLELARVGSGWLELVYCILLNSICKTAPLNIFPTSPALCAGLITILTLWKPTNSRNKRIPAIIQ